MKHSDSQHALEYCNNTTFRIFGFYWLLAIGKWRAPSVSPHNYGQLT